NSLLVIACYFEDLAAKPSRVEEDRMFSIGGTSLLIARHCAGRCDHSMPEAFGREKRFWMYTKQAEKDAPVRPTRDKENVNGEVSGILGVVTACCWWVNRTVH